MARDRDRKSGGNRPQFNVSFSYKESKREYANQQLTGLWKRGKDDSENGPLLRGSLDEKRIEEVIEYLEDGLKAGENVSLEVWEAKDDEREERGSRRGRG